MSTKVFYSYLWLRENGTPYYVGKGCNRRAFVSAGHCVRRPKSHSRINIQEHESEADAFEAEIFLISYYGRIDLGTGCLHNITNGGEGNANPSLETRQKRSRSLMGNRNSEGYVRPLELRKQVAEKVRIFLTGRILPQEHRDNVSKGVSLYYSTLSEEKKLEHGRKTSEGMRQAKLRRAGEPVVKKVRKSPSTKGKTHTEIHGEEQSKLLVEHLRQAAKTWYASQTPEWKAARVKKIQETKLRKKLARLQKAIAA